MDHGKLIALDTLDNLIANHAPGAVELSVEGDEERVAEALGSFGPVTRESGRFRVQVEDKVGAVVKAVEACEAHIKSLSILEADLETVFLTLTGRSLRDAP